MSYRKILIPLDGSELSQVALTASFPIVEKFDSEILFVGVLDLTAGVYDAYSEAFSPIDIREQLQTFVETTLAKAVARAEASGLRARSVLETGIPHEEVARVAERENVDLIVMTTHGRKGLSHLLLGSVTEKVIRTAPCPVLVVRPEQPAAEGGQSPGEEET